MSVLTIVMTDNSTPASTYSATDAQAAVESLRLELNKNVSRAQSQGGQWITTSITAS